MNTNEVLCLSRPPLKLNCLHKVYEEAICNAEKLYILNAFLTEWSYKHKLNDNCEVFKFICGKYDDITEPTALRNVLSWIPDKFKKKQGNEYSFRIHDSQEGYFHPKMILWRTGCTYFLCIGSSNLTFAGQKNNFEANYCTDISCNEFEIAKVWINKIDNLKNVDDVFIKQYELEREINGHHRNVNLPIIGLPYGEEIDKAIWERREQISKFNRSKLTNLFHECANGEISSKEFYKQMNESWTYPARFQGRGYERTKERYNWQLICKVLVKIFETPEYLFYDTVRDGINCLAREKTPFVAWLSEMLCHYYPDKFPVFNQPVWHWIRYNKIRPPRGCSEGDKYIYYAKVFRKALLFNIANKGACKARDLAELDYAIWKWHDKLKTRKS